jgi:hypothetical protein
MSHPKPKRPDGDPLEVTPHERFELATREDGAIAPYELVIARMARPMLNELGRRGYGAWREVTEVVERISWAYQVPKERVADDIEAAQRKYLDANMMRALNEGAYWIEGQDGITDAY